MTFDPHDHPEFLDRLNDAVMARDGRAKPSGEVEFTCPNENRHSNNDRTPSASWNVDKAAWVCRTQRCHEEVGGGAMALAKELGVELPNDRTEWRPAPPNLRINVGRGTTTFYPYQDADGVERWRVRRIDTPDGKDIRPQHLNEGGVWVTSKGVTPWPPYRLPGLLAADPSEIVFVVEGEKVADRLAEEGLVATTNDGGATRWKDQHATTLRGRHVTILPDNDSPGRDHAEVVALSLVGIAASTKVLELPHLPAKGDAVDWLANGGTAADLRRLADSAPEWVEPTMVSTPPPTPEDTWPVLDPAALYGLPGDVVRALDPFTEGDPVATLVNYLVMFGNAVGLSPHTMVGERKHHANEFAVLVGATSKGRKGTSHDGPLAIMTGADPMWSDRVMGGLASGEGLIWPVRDETTATRKGVEVIDDVGVSDKRLLAVEEEFSAVCAVASREGNTLSQTLRKAWDSNSLGNMTKKEPSRCLSPHISMLGHVTQSELLRVMGDSSAANGFGNRFLWICVKRSKFLPEGDPIPAEVRVNLVNRTRAALDSARKSPMIRRDNDAKEIWGSLYDDLSGAGVGLLGAMTDRGEAHVLRLSLLYSLADGAKVMTVDHLMAALALWEYSVASARHIFGDATGDPIADRVMSVLRTSGELDRTQISDLFGRHKDATQLDRALEALLSAGRVRTWREDTAGRPRNVWSAV